MTSKIQYKLNNRLSLLQWDNCKTRKGTKYYKKTIKSGHSKIRPKICLSRPIITQCSQKYCRMFQGSILQYFRCSSSYNLSLRPLFCLFLSGRLRQVLLYVTKQGPTTKKNPHTMGASIYTMEIEHSTCTTEILRSFLVLKGEPYHSVHSYKVLR